MGLSPKVSAIPLFEVKPVFYLHNTLEINLDLPQHLRLEWHLTDIICFRYQFCILKRCPILVWRLSVLVGIFLRVHHAVCDKWLSFTFLLCSFWILRRFVSSFFKFSIFCRDYTYIARTWFERINLCRLSSFFRFTVGTFLRVCWSKLLISQIISILITWFWTAAIDSH